MFAILALPVASVRCFIVSTMSPNPISLRSVAQVATPPRIANFAAELQFTPPLQEIGFFGLPSSSYRRGDTEAHVQRFLIFAAAVTAGAAYAVVTTERKARPFVNSTKGAHPMRLSRRLSRPRARISMAKGGSLNEGLSALEKVVSDLNAAFPWASSSAAERRAASVRSFEALESSREARTFRVFARPNKSCQAGRDASGRFQPGAAIRTRLNNHE